MNSEQKRRDVLTIMEMFAIDFSEASAAYEKQHQNLDNTIQLLLNRQCNQTSIPQNDTYSIDQKNNKQQDSSRQIYVQKMRDMRKKDNQEIPQLTAEQIRQRFKTNYLLKKKSTARRFKQQIQDQTVIRLQKYLNQLVPVNFFEENNDVFNELWNTHKFIAVHCLSIPSAINPKNIQEQMKRSFYTQIYCSQKFATIFNKEFLNMVVDPTSQDFYQSKIIRQFIKQKDINCIVILRLHPITKLIVRAHSMNIMSVIKSQSPENFQKHLVRLRRDINREIQMEICPNIRHNSLNDTQKLKLDNDRKIKTEQQIAYKIMEQQSKMSKNSQIDQKVQVKTKQPKRKSSDSEDEEIKRMKQQVMKSVQQSIIKQRQEKLSKMKKYTPEQLQSPISLKIRYPNGTQIQLTLPKTETLQYLIDYITCQKQILGFYNQLARNFVLAQPWSSTDFNNMENKTFLQLFNESSGELLIVKQIY